MVIDLGLEVLIYSNGPLTFWLWYMAWLAVGTGIVAATPGKPLSRVLPVITWLVVGGLSFLFVGALPVWIALIWWWVTGPAAYLVEWSQKHHSG